MVAATWRAIGCGSRSASLVKALTTAWSYSSDQRAISRVARNSTIASASESGSGGRNDFFSIPYRPRPALKIGIPSSSSSALMSR